MPKRVPTQGILVQRNGKNFRPPIGQPFDFTPEELEDIKKANPHAVTTISTVDLNASEEQRLASDAEARAKADAEAHAAAEKKAKDEAAKARGAAGSKSAAGDL